MLHCQTPSASALDYLQGYLTPVIAVLALLIALFQYKNARDKLRLDLYSKRFAVYAATREFLVHILREADMSLEKRTEFLLGTAEAEFLFKPEIPEYLKLLHAKGVDFRHLQIKLRDRKGMEDSEAEEAITKDGELLVWFNSQISEASSKFGRYLRFE